MKEEDLIDLGFTKEFESDYYYYVLDIANGFSFISCASDEVEDGFWFVEFFDSEPNIKFEYKEDLYTMIKLAIRNRLD
jgi:hypothetical protein